MNGAKEFLDACVLFSLAVLSVSFVLIVIRIYRGPTLPDRIVALDMLVSVGIGFIAVIGASRPAISSIWTLPSHLVWSASSPPSRSRGSC